MMKSNDSNYLFLKLILSRNKLQKWLKYRTSLQTSKNAARFPYVSFDFISF